MNSVSRNSEPNKSHVMSEWRIEIRCPASTPRFYSVRNCAVCGYEEMIHAAGHFMDDELILACSETDDNAH